MKNKSCWLILVILIAAAFLRLYKIGDYMTFLGDEGRDVLVVKLMIVDHKFTLLGPTASVGGFFLGPLYYYLMAPFLWLFRLDPVGPAVMVALFGVATVGLIYKFGEKFLTRQAGLIAAILYAVSPLVITYSRASWNPNLVPFFSLLLIYRLRFSVEQKRRQDWLAGGFLLGVLLQLHYLAVFLAVISLFYWLLFHPQGRNFKSYLLVLVGLAIGWFPFLLFEIRHNFPNFISLYRFIFYGEETGLATGGLSRVGDIVYRLYSRLVTNNESILAWGLLACSLVFLVYHWWHSRKDQNDLRTSSLLGIWLILGVSLFIFYRKPVYDYYLGFLFSLPFLLTAMALDKTAAWGKQGKIIFYLVGLILLVVNLKGAPFRFVPNRQLTQTKEVARFILTRVAGRPFNFALITGSNSDHAYRYFFEIWGNPPVVIENLQVDPTRKTVTDQLWVICETLPCVPEGHSLWEIAGFGRAKIVGEWQVSVVKVYQLKHYQGNE